ncbi:hypothetical protein [Actinomadura rugatobispora]|uniref:Uncharacterized protein n=1 Tax=Actinomadura rugatobispora TaxID=1994 RepID=A0ABW1AEF8_9ACTN|nr:hypothetical protein GCM10010200_033530 [Actinomadura rugatobispora]
MDTRPLRLLLTANLAVFVLVCVAFLVHYLGLGLFPGGMESWLEENQWLMWTATALTGASALALPLLSMKTRR